MAEKETGTDTGDPPKADISARAKVRVHLLEPLTLWGLRRQAKAKVADHDAMIDRLTDAFAHMSEQSLRGLRDIITRHAGGRDQNEWPDEVTVRKWAMAIQPKPYRSNDYVRSIMQSRMGQQARGAGYHVELFMLATKMGPPPGRYNLGRLAAQGSDNQRKLTLVRERMARGAASQDQLDWLAWYEAQAAACAEVMGAGT